MDTSALVKLYVDEEDRELVFEAVGASEVIATSPIAYAEARSAFSRRSREGEMSGEEHRRAVERLDEQWVGYARLAVSNSVAYRAGEMVERYGLRGFDAVHLASAVRLRERFGDLRFLAFDERLTEAARQVLPVFGEEDGQGA